MATNIKGPVGCIQQWPKWTFCFPERHCTNTQKAFKLCGIGKRKRAFLSSERGWRCLKARVGIFLPALKRVGMPSWAGNLGHSFTETSCEGHLCGPNFVIPPKCTRDKRLLGPHRAGFLLVCFFMCFLFLDGTSRHPPGRLIPARQTSKSWVLSLHCGESDLSTLWVQPASTGKRVEHLSCRVGASPLIGKELTGSALWNPSYPSWAQFSGGRENSSEEDISRIRFSGTIVWYQEEMPNISSVD